MSDLLAFLNKNAGALTVLFSLVVTAATVFYALLTRRLVVETAQMRRAQTDAHVAVRVEPTEDWINFVVLVIENVGAGPAYDVRLSASPDFEMERSRKLSELGIFKHGFHYLAPGQRIQLFLASLVGQTDEIERPGGKFEFTVTARYRTASGDMQNHSYPIDFRHLIGMTTIGTPPLRSIARDVEKIKDSISRLQSGWSRLKVDMYTEGDRARAAEEWERQRLETKWPDKPDVEASEVREEREKEDPEA